MGHRIGSDIVFKALCENITSSKPQGKKFIHIKGLCSICQCPDPILRT